MRRKYGCSPPHLSVYVDVSFPPSWKESTHWQIILKPGRLGRVFYVT